MSFIERLFGGASKQKPQPDIPFGRYTDAYKTEAQQADWDRSLELFDKGQPMDAYRAFLRYLRDERENNINWREESGAIHFEFWQGSRRITGFANSEKVKAESKIARAEDLNVGFLRRLMENNFSLKFSRFALSPDNCLAILFDTRTQDGSPLKLLSALRELAINADKQDDLLLEEFRMLSPAEPPAEVGEIPEAEKEVKYNFLRREIEAAFALLDAAKPDPNQYPGGYAYLLLGLAFKLDYLIRPEGFMMDVLEKVHGTYFAKDERKPQVKIIALRKEFQKLLDRPKASFFREMYRTRCTFGINPPVPHDRIQSLIDGELPNMDWHLNQNHPELALAIPKYIAGYALFHFAPPKPLRAFLHLFFQILEPAFFRDMGFELHFMGANGLPDKNAVSKAIRTTVEQYHGQYPRLKPDANKLNFTTLALFARSYMEMIRDLDLSKAE